MGQSQLVMYGGRDASREVDDTWTFDGSTWTEVPGAPPSGMWGEPGAPSTAMLGEKAVYFGGIQSAPQGDTFTFASNARTLVSFTAHPFVPVPRGGAAMAALP